MAVGLTQILFSCTTINLVCECSGSEILKELSTHEKIIPTFDVEGAHLSTRLKACTCPKRDTQANSGR